MEPYYLVAYRYNEATEETDEVPVAFVGEAADYDSALEAVLKLPYVFQGQELRMGPQELIEDGHGILYELKPAQEIPIIECCLDLKLDLQLDMALGGAPEKQNVATILTDVAMRLNGDRVEIAEEQQADGYYFLYYFNGVLNEGDDDYERIRALLVTGKDE